MNPATRILGGVCLVLSLASCLFEKPVFTGGFAKVDPALGGVWISDSSGEDPRERGFAVFAPLDDERYLLHHPTGRGGGGIYYEARALRVRERELLQLRVVASFDNGLPKGEVRPWTLVWIERAADGAVRVRALDTNQPLKDKSPDEVRAFLDDPKSDWDKAFAEATTFRRLPDR